jgi:hypothetical protein
MKAAHARIIKRMNRILRRMRAIKKQLQTKQQKG